MCMCAKRLPGSLRREEEKRDRMKTQVGRKILLGKIECHMMIFVMFFKGVLFVLAGYKHYSVAKRGRRTGSRTKTPEEGHCNL